MFWQESATLVTSLAGKGRPYRLLRKSRKGVMVSENIGIGGAKFRRKHRTGERLLDYDLDGT